MLDDDLDRSERHVPTWHLVGGSSPPFVGRNGLKEALDCGEKLDWVEYFFLAIVRYVSSQLPDTFEDELGHLGFLGVWQGPLGREWLHDLQQQSKQRARRNVSIGKA